MTDIGSCKTCRYFDSQDWDSETKNWCRYNDLPATNEGLCGHYDPMIKPCPFCGKSAVLYASRPSQWIVRCMNLRCGCCLVAHYKEEVIKKWNRRVNE